MLSWGGERGRYSERGDLLFSLFLYILETLYWEHSGSRSCISHPEMMFALHYFLPLFSRQDTQTNDERGSLLFSFSVRVLIESVIHEAEVLSTESLSCANRRAAVGFINTNTHTKACTYARTKHKHNTSEFARRLANKRSLLGTFSAALCNSCFCPNDVFNKR